jgi:hypothetical protein
VNLIIDVSLPCPAFMYKSHHSSLLEFSKTQLCNYSTLNPEHQLNPYPNGQATNSAKHAGAHPQGTAGKGVSVPRAGYRYVKGITTTQMNLVQNLISLFPSDFDVLPRRQAHLARGREQSGHCMQVSCYGEGSVLQRWEDD